MKICLLAGEASGDLHAANLVKEMRLQNSDLDLFGFGGDRMAAEGVRIDKHYREMAFMGFLEVVKNLKSIKRNFNDLYAILEKEMPEKIILIDFPGFNLRVAKWAKAKGIEVIYYISPQIWAWKKKRVFTIKKVVDKMLCILPFEKDFYAQFDVTVDYVGHPLIDEIERRKKEFDLSDISEQYIALLPGSRNQEISKMLPLMLKLAALFSAKKFKIGKAPTQDRAYYEKFNLPSNVELFERGSSLLLQNAEAAVVTSGTATLETALYKVPQVVVYSASAVSYQIAKRVINVKYISLVNLILDRELVKELIQRDFNLTRLKSELELLLNEAKRNEILQGYDELEQKLGGTGASARAAKLVLST